MIQLNGQEMGKCTFPDGTSRIMGAECNEPNIDDVISTTVFNVLTFRYDSPRDLENLIYITLHIKEKYPDAKLELEMPYIPNARMDRVYNINEVFTLKYFAKLINWLGFDSVRVCDPHSNVSEALIDRLYHIPMPNPEFISSICKSKNIDVVYFPDAGSQKRYKHLLDDMKVDVLHGEKIRDFATGKIFGLEVKSDSSAGVDVKGKNVLMIDDIVSYGGTFAYSADKLKELGANDIYAYATHTENSVLDENKGTFIKRINDGTVKKLITTDSLFSASHPSIDVVPITAWSTNIYEHL